MTKNQTTRPKLAEIAPSGNTIQNVTFPLQAIPRGGTIIVPSEEGRVWKGKQVTAARLVISPTRDIPDNATIAVYAPPLAWSQLALILDLADTAGLRREFPKAYEALDEIRLGLDAVMEPAPIPSPREQWDKVKNDRDHLLARFDQVPGIGIEPGFRTPEVG